MKLNWKYFIMCTITVGVVLGLFSQPSVWRFAIGPLHTNKEDTYPFRDMNARLGMAEGIANGIAINHEVNPYTDFAGLNNKPLYTVRAMALLSLDRSNRVTLGLFFGALYLAWSLWLMRPSTWLEVTICLAVILSPAALLLIERANDDIIIYVFILFVPLLLHGSRTKLNGMGWLIICLLTPMKYYPAAAFALFLHRTRGIKELASYVAATLAFAVVLGWFIRDELQLISSRIPSPSSSFAFGKQLLFSSYTENSLVINLGFYGLLALITLAAVLILLTPKSSKEVGTPKTQSFFLLGSSILTFCFLLNSNWDYRLAFVIPTIPYTLELLRCVSKRSQCLGALYLFGILFTAWPEYLYFWSIADLEEGRWILNRDTYTNILAIKHCGSWVMLSGSILISTQILKTDIRQLASELPTLLRGQK